jgi:hypothetical protein
MRDPDFCVWGTPLEGFDQFGNFKRPLNHGASQQRDHAAFRRGIAIYVSLSNGYRAVSC